MERLILLIASFLCTPAAAGEIGCGTVIEGATLATPADSIVYTFAAGRGEHVVFETFRDPTQRPLNTLVSVRDAGCGTTLARNNDKAYGDLYSRLEWCAPATGTYCIVVASYGGSIGGYRATLACTPAAPDVGDTCEAAPAIPCGAFEIRGSTRCMANDYDPGHAGCTRYAATGSDVVYRVQSGAGARFDVEYRSTADASLYLVRDCRDIAGTCIGGADAGLAGDAEKLGVELPTTAAYALVLDHHAGGQGEFVMRGFLECSSAVVKSVRWQQLKQLYREE